jgi:tetraacyldisaccharide 4'-kinase
VDVVDGTLARSLGRGALRGARVLAVSGLARPGAFRRTLADLGAEVVGERVFPDHHRFTERELDDALRAADDARARVVMTEKDAVRLAPARAADPRLCAVRIEAEIVHGEELLARALDAALARGAAPSRSAG